MSDTLKIDYIEFKSPDVEGLEQFFSQAFGWTYTEYGPDYRDISGAGTGGGIERGPHCCPLIVLKADDLEAALQSVKDAGGTITKDIFKFPGGRRFEFTEPGGTAMAVWTPLDED